MSVPDETLEALRATDLWLRTLIDELEIDPAEIAFNVDAVNPNIGQRRALARSTLAERLASNAVLLDNSTSPQRQ